MSAPVGCSSASPLRPCSSRFFDHSPALLPPPPPLVCRSPPALPVPRDPPLYRHAASPPGLCPLFRPPPLSPLPSLLLGPLAALSWLAPPALLSVGFRRWPGATFPCPGRGSCALRSRSLLPFLPLILFGHVSSLLFYPVPPAGSVLSSFALPPALPGFSIPCFRSALGGPFSTGSRSSDLSLFHRFFLRALCPLFPCFCFPPSGLSACACSLRSLLSGSCRRLGVLLFCFA